MTRNLTEKYRHRAEIDMDRTRASPYRVYCTSTSSYWQLALRLVALRTYVLLGVQFTLVHVAEAAGSLAGHACGPHWRRTLLHHETKPVMSSCNTSR
ncbi:hypothetical protein BV20DRAFT_811918 [Pilatotrama ljubarskyi]|nr:hypothetical protein BV20DRAFT_811918 [Pilatotrama ljubarskyi]